MPVRARLRIVCENEFEELVRLYYFSLEETAINLNVPGKWIRQKLFHFPDKYRLDETWYFSPDDYARLRQLRNDNGFWI